MIERKILFMPARFLAIGYTAAIFALQGIARADDLTENEIRRLVGMRHGLAVLIEAPEAAGDELALSGRWLVHELWTDAAFIPKRRAAIDRLGLGGRIKVDPLSMDGHLPHPDLFVNLLVLDSSRVPSERRPRPDEIRRVLAVRGAALVRSRENDSWRQESLSLRRDIDGWFSHWYDATGNCVSRDAVAAFPNAVQWQHGPALEDATSDGKIPRIGNGRLVVLDSISGELVCRDAGNGLLLWHRYIGSDPKGDVAIAGNRVHLWYDPAVENEDHDPHRRRERGLLTALALEDGRIVQTYAEGLRAGAAASIERSTEGRTRRFDPVPWFIVDDRFVIQAYGARLVALERETGEKLWEHTLESGWTWFSPVAWKRVVLAAEAVTPAERRRNNGTEHAQAVVAFDAWTGEIRWRNDEIHPERELEGKDGRFRSRASFKTLSVAGDRVLLHTSSYQFRAGGSIAVLDVSNGHEIWRRHFAPKQLYTEGSQRAVIRGDEVVLLDGTGIYRYSLASGEPLAEPVRAPRSLERTGRTNGACTASRATVDWLIANAWLYVGPDGTARVTRGARGACGQGVVPANGLIFVPPTACDCGDYARGYLALAPRVPGRPLEERQRLARHAKAPDSEGFRSEWPIFLGDPERRSAAERDLDGRLELRWSTQLAEGARLGDSIDLDRRRSERYRGALSAPVIGGGMVIVSVLEEHRIAALDAESGSRLWSFLAGGKVDSPPTLASGLAVFGSDDGSVYALRLDDGALVWRFRAAPTDTIASLHGHLASAFPIPGSVLILENRVLAVAGQHTDLGGLHVWSLDLATGEARARRTLDAEGTPALANNITVADADGRGFWVASPPGGAYGAGGAYHMNLDLEVLPRTREDPGPAMWFDRQGSRIRFRTSTARGGSTHGWKGAMRAGHFQRLAGHRVAIRGGIGFALLDPDGRAKPVVWATEDRGRDPQALWELSATELGDVESLGAIVAAGEKVIVGGGKRDGTEGDIFVLDAKLGRVVERIKPSSRVSECGLAVVDQGLIVCCEDGTVRWFEAVAER